MAFPLEPTQLRAQQRKFYLATCENDFDSTKRIIKPLTSGLFYDKCNANYFDDYQPSSPPIPVALSETSFKPTLVIPSSSHKRQSSRATNKVLHVRRKSKMSVSKFKEPLTESTSKTESIDLKETTLPDESFVASEEPKKSSAKKNPLSKLFVKSDKQRIHENDSQSTISRSSLGTPAESLTNSSISEPAIDRFGDYSGSEVSINDSLTDEDAYISDDVETLENADASQTGSDEESLNSAFTDIEGDSMINGSPDMMYDYIGPETSVLRGDTETKNTQESKSEASLYNKKSINMASFPSTSKKSPMASTSDGDRITSVLRRKESFSFPKIHEVPSQKSPEVKSKLSMIIQTRHISSNANPLTFFSYSGVDSTENGRKAEVSIFVPPSTSVILKKVPIAGNMAVFDCIGFILLKLSELNGEDKTGQPELSLNPNHWRLELTDDDGELYDSNFGVLDRTRLISSYNYPKYLALCKVQKDAEIAKNEKQSPLPLEFKQNLELYEERSRNGKENGTDIVQRIENLDFTAPGGNSVDVKVKNIPSTSKVISFFVAAKMQVGELLDLICRQYQVDSTKFKLSGFQVSGSKKMGASSLLSDRDTQDEGQTVQLQINQSLSEIHVDYFTMDPIIRQTIRSMLDVKTKRNSYQEAGITPNSSGFIQSGITPTVTQLDTKSQYATESSSKSEKDADLRALKPPGENSSKTAKKNLNSTSSSVIDNLISGKNSQLPSSLNTFYCKWKVFRKKAPLIYRIEKSLIIDGDYIHLAPTDDTNWKSTFHDNSFSATGQSGSQHHHHYLHHYNYTKYYNDTMLKTSSFHISQIIKLKSYKESKSPTHFKIVIKKEVESGGKETVIKKKYDLEAETTTQCDDIFEKIKWALQLYNASNTA